MTDFHDLTNKKLKKLLKETESTLAELQAEMARRELESQEREIENLDNHLDETHVSLKTIRDFISFLRSES